MIRPKCPSLFHSRCNEGLLYGGRPPKSICDGEGTRCYPWKDKIEKRSAASMNCTFVSGALSAPHCQKEMPGSEFNFRGIWPAPISSTFLHNHIDASKKDATASTTTVRDVPATRIEPSRHVSALSSMRLEWVYLLATSSLLVTRSTTELSRRMLVLIDDD